MIRVKLLLISTILVSILGCRATESSYDIDSDRGFDMWNYMTSTLNYEVEYDIYNNGDKQDYYIEDNRVFDNGKTYERRSANDRTVLYLNSNYILMKEPSRDVEIKRFVHLGDNHIFNASNIDNCSLDRFYPKYIVYNSTFNNVLRVNCLTKSGVKQELYYGYSEGIVAIYQNDHSTITEYVKVNEKPIF